jgi:hypothetical protein
MTEHSAHRHARHAAHVKGLYGLAAFIEPHSSVPTPDHLVSVTAVATPAALVDIAIELGIDGPFEAADGHYLHRGFSGGVSWQAVCHADRNDTSADERHARAWAALHGCLIVPIDHATGSVTP